MEKYSINKITKNLLKSLTLKIISIKAMIDLKNKKIMKMKNGAIFNKINTILKILKILIKNFKQ
jgi:hypothetical protein